MDSIKHSTRTGSSRNQNKNNGTRIIGRILVIVFVIQLVAIFLPPQIHRLGGVLFVALLVVHLFQHRKWIMSLFKGHYTAKRKRMTVINIGLLVCLIGLAISGFSILGTTRHLLMTLSFGPIEILHVFFVLAALTLTIAHLHPIHKRMHNAAHN